MSFRKARVSRRLREQVVRAAGHCCGYCRTPERIAGFRLSIEHISGTRIPANAATATDRNGRSRIRKNAGLRQGGAHPRARSRNRAAHPLMESAAPEMARSFLVE